jgi:two-component system chemotaxis response regulator CheY
MLMKKVLIINPVRDALARDTNILARDDLRIFTASTAEEGLRIHRKEMVNLILTDFDLPDMGGDVLCSRIRQEQTLRKVSIIVLCRDVPEEFARAKSCGANVRLLKPIKPELLEDCVGKLLDVPARQQCRVLVRAQLFGKQGMTTLFGTSRNISVSGLLIVSDDLLAVGERISCMFFLPGRRQITAVGEVVRTIRQSRIMHQYGIKFISLYPQVQTEIENFVASAQAA